MEKAIELYVMFLTECIPYALVFSVGNLMVSMFFKMAFRGRVEIG